MPDETDETEAQALLRALTALTSGIRDLADEVRRLREEFQKLHASAPPPKAHDAAGHVAQAIVEEAGPALENVLRETFGIGKKRKKGERS